jgi:hypothetical protein
MGWDGMGWLRMERAAHEIEERAAGRHRSKKRFEIRAALEEGLAALEDDDDDDDNDDDTDDDDDDDDDDEEDEDVADADDVTATDGNAITPAGRPARSYLHPQLPHISSHISAEENPVTVARNNVLTAAMILNVQPSVVEPRAATAAQSHKGHHIAPTVCQTSENQSVCARTNQCQTSVRQQTTTTADNNSSNNNNNNNNNNRQ